MENLWHLRRVAENASKACWICYKSTTSVLITPNNKDFFYICPGHLVDKGFCQPDAVEAKKKKDELDAEIEKVKKEYDEKQKLKREKRKAKDKEKDKAEEKEAKSKDEEQDTKDEKAKDDKVRYIHFMSAYVTYIVSRSKSFLRRKRTLKMILGLAYSASISKYDVMALPQRSTSILCMLISATGASIRCESTRFAMQKSLSGTARDLATLPTSQPYRVAILDWGQSDPYWAVNVAIMYTSHPQIIDGGDHTLSG
jgi:hypothetical protein